MEAFCGAGPPFTRPPADPDGGYQSHTYTVRFLMAQPVDCTLFLEVIASTPRLPDIRISINGKDGMLYPYPMPSRDNEIKPAHALHAAIYNKDTLTVPLHKGLFAAGENTLTVTAVDDGSCLAVENPPGCFAAGPHGIRLWFSLWQDGALPGASRKHAGYVAICGPAQSM